MKTKFIVMFVALALLASSVASAGAPGVTTRASVASDGTQGNDDSWSSALSADGRYVAFQSAAGNLVAGDTNGTWDIFVRDRTTGATTRVSVASDGTQGNSASSAPVLSADGRTVAFYSSASNLVVGDTGWADVFVRDLTTGVTRRVSVASDGSQANSDSVIPALSADGRYVAFVSLASNLVAGDTNGQSDVFVRDLAMGQTVRVSFASDGAQANGWSRSPTISADGRYVAFTSTASNLVPGDTNTVEDVFVRDLAQEASSRGWP